MRLVPPALLELAFRLRYLRVDQWPDEKLTQGTLAKALGGDEPLSPATVASWENRNAPKLPPRERLLAYAQFFATRRSLGTTKPALMPIDSFTAEEETAYTALRDELLQMHAAARGTAPEPLPARRSWHFSDTGPLTFVCPQLPEDQTPVMASHDNVNYTELLSFGDLDAMVELFGHVRAENPSMEVCYKTGTRLLADDMSGHLVVIGGIGWNDVMRRLLELSRLPVTQIRDPANADGEIFATEIGGEQRRYLPKRSEGELVEDVGLLVRMPNPLNSSRTLTICNGVHSRGVLGAVRCLTDARLRENNEHYIARNFLHDRQYGIIMRIQVIEGRALTPDFSIPGTVLCQWSEEHGH